MSKVVALALLLCACGHQLEDGVYNFKMTQVLRDDCQLLPTFTFGPGTLTTSGGIVRLRLAAPQFVMAGFYRKGIESMVLDGTRTNENMTINGTECLARIVAIHAEIDAVTATTMRGAASVRIDAPEATRCSCTALFQFDGAK